MITRNRMLRLWHQRRHAALADRILENGRLPDARTRAYLLATEPIEVVALGLALQRLCELLHGVDGELRDLVDELLLHQAPDGSFGSLAATAVAVRALLDVLDGVVDADPGWLTSAGAGLSFLTRHQRADGLFDEGLLANEIVAWQLGASDAFASGHGYERFRASLPDGSTLGLGRQLKGLARATMIAA